MSIPTTDIGYAVEQVVIEILSTNPQLAALNPRHEDDDTDSTNNRIVVNAIHVYPEAPNQVNPLKNVRRVEVQAMVRNSLGQSTASDLYSAYGTMCQILENLDGNIYGTIPAIALFNYLQPNVALENEREREENRRKMVKTINFLAILVNGA